MNKLRPLATALRRDGYSYSYISKELGVAKSTLKQDAKNGKLPYGTLHVCVVSAGNPEFGVRLHRRMMGWVSAIL